MEQKPGERNKCTGCGDCMPCAHGVDIPENFALWNEDSKDGQGAARYKKLGEGQAIHCAGCGKCEDVCPQGIRIRKDLMEVAFSYPRK